MPSLLYTSAKSENDLLGIIQLQERNLSPNLTPEEIGSQGFVTVAHTLAVLKKMNEIEQHVICKDGDTVVAYVLAMTAASRHDIPILDPMFEAFDVVRYRERPVSQYKYMVVGQVCVDKQYRGKGIFNQCYAEYKKSFRGKYDFAITEIATRNVRSIQAHRRIGFSEIYSYASPDSEEWSVVIWQW